MDDVHMYKHNEWASALENRINYVHFCAHRMLAKTSSVVAYDGLDADAGAPHRAVRKESYEKTMQRDQKYCRKTSNGIIRIVCRALFAAQNRAHTNT